MKLEKVSIVRLAATDRAARVAEALQSPGVLDAAKVLKAEGKAWVRLIEVSGEQFVVKCRPLHTLRRRLQSLLALGHAHRQWRGARLLKQAGILTAEPLLIARAAIDTVPCELLALEYVPGQTLLEVLNDRKHNGETGVRQQHAIARAVGALIPTLLAARLHNRDNKPSNLIVLLEPKGNVKVSVIDCVGIEGCKLMRIDDIEGLDMLASLMIEPIGCNCPPRRALWMRALRAAEAGASTTRTERRANCRAIIQEVQWAIDNHPDPRPKTNPLSTSPS